MPMGPGWSESLGLSRSATDHVVFVLRLRVNDERAMLGTPDFEPGFLIKGESAGVQGVHSEVDLHHVQKLPSELKRVLK